MKGGRASDRVFFNRCDASLPSLVRTSSTQPFPRRVLALPPGSGMAFDLAEKIDRQLRRAVRTRGDDMSLTQGYLRDVL